jgi:hypothetical protein
MYAEMPRYFKENLQREYPQLHVLGRAPEDDVDIPLEYRSILKTAGLGYVFIIDEQ